MHPLQSTYHVIAISYTLIPDMRYKLFPVLIKF